MFLVLFTAALMGLIIYTTMRNFILLLVIVAASSCCPKIYPSYNNESHLDSVRVEYRERIVRDTVLVEIPFIEQQNITRDTVSHLENAYCSSDASVKEGELHHTLATKPQNIKAPVAVTVRDTIIVHVKGDTVVKEKVVEVAKPLSGWVRFWRNFGYCSGLAILIWLIFTVVSKRRTILAFIRKILSL